MIVKGLRAHSAHPLPAPYPQSGAPTHTQIFDDSCQGQPHQRVNLQWSLGSLRKSNGAWRTKTKALKGASLFRPLLGPGAMSNFLTNPCDLLSLLSLKHPDKTPVSGQGNPEPPTSPGTPALTLCLDGIGIDRGIGSSGSPPRL